MTTPQLNSAARIEVRHFGAENQPLVVIDDALADPQTLVGAALKTTFSAPPGGFYPGLNAPMQREYVSRLVAKLRPILAANFGLPDEAVLDLSGYFGLATQAASVLKPVQKIPHIDSTNPFQIALLHYVVSGQQGGTGFYRQDETGFESIDAQRHATYTESYRLQLAEGGQFLTRHVGAHTPGYTLIASVEAAFNRMILYRSNCLHSGLLETSVLSNDPTTGRLTANVFVRPRST